MESISADSAILLKKASTFAAFAAEQAAALSDQIDRTPAEATDDLMAYAAAWEHTAVSAARFVTACTDAEDLAGLQKLVDILALAPEGWDRIPNDPEKSRLDHAECNEDRPAQALVSSQTLQKVADVSRAPEVVQQTASIKDRFQWLLNHPLAAEGIVHDTPAGGEACSSIEEDCITLLQRKYNAIKEVQNAGILQTDRFLANCNHDQYGIVGALRPDHAKRRPIPEWEQDNIICSLESAAAQLRAQERSIMPQQALGEDCEFESENEESTVDWQEALKGQPSVRDDLVGRKGAVDHELQHSGDLMYWQLPPVQAKCQRPSKKSSKKAPMEFSQAPAECPADGDISPQALDSSSENQNIARHDRLHADAHLREQRRARAQEQQCQAGLCRAIDYEHIACLHEDADMRQTRLLNAQKNHAEKLLEEDLEHLAVANQLGLEVDPVQVKSRIEALHADGHRRHLQKLKAQRLNDELLQQQAQRGSSSVKAPKTVEASITRLCNAHQGKYERWEAERKRREEEELSQIQQMSVHAVAGGHRLSNRHQQLYEDSSKRNFHHQKLLEEKVQQTEQMLAECSVHRGASAGRSKSAESKTAEQNPECDLLTSNNAWVEDDELVECSDQGAVKPKKLLTLSMARKKAASKKREGVDHSHEYAIPDDGSTTCPESDDGRSFSASTASCLKAQPSGACPRHHTPPTTKVTPTDTASPSQLPLSPSNLRKLEKAYGASQTISNKKKERGDDQSNEPHDASPTCPRSDDGASCSKSQTWPVRARYRTLSPAIQVTTTERDSPDQLPLSPTNLRKREKVHSASKFDGKMALAESRLQPPSSDSSPSKMQKTGKLMRSQPQECNSSNIAPQQTSTDTQTYEERKPKRVLRKAGPAKLVEVESPKYFPNPEVSKSQCWVERDAIVKQSPECKPRHAATQGEAIKKTVYCSDFAAANAAFADEDKQFMTMFSSSAQSRMFQNVRSENVVRHDKPRNDLADYLPQ